MNLPDQLKQAVVKITTTNSYQTGFFIGENLVLTCKHGCIADRNAAICFNNAEFAITKKYFSSTSDLAVIEVNAANASFILLNSNVKIGDDVFVYGFWTEFPAGDSTTLTCEGTNIKSVDGILHKFKNGQINRGMSGSPVLNLRTGAICAVTIISRSSEYALGSYAVSVAALFEEFPEHLISQYDFNNSTWFQLLQNPQRCCLRKFHHEITQGNSLDLKSNLIRERLTQILEQFNVEVTGSQRIRILDLINTDNFLLPFCAYSITGDKDYSDLLSELYSKHQTGEKYLVLSDPGIGKSTFAYIIYYRIINAFLAGETKTLPLHLDLKMHLKDDNFGTMNWLCSQIEKVYGYSPKYSSDNRIISPLNLPYYIIFDSFDEAISGYTLSETNALMNSNAIKCANIIMCRKQNYDQLVFVSETSKYFNKIVIKNWSYSESKKYITNYLAFCRLSHEEQQSILRLFDSSCSMQALSTIPLHANMLLDLLISNRDCNVTSLTALYRLSLEQRLAMESIGQNSVLQPPEKTELIESIAWEYYDENQVGQKNTDISFTKIEFTRFLEQNSSLCFNKNRAKVVEEMIEHSFLMLGPNGLDTNTIKFRHKSFQEFYVASYIFKVMCEDAAKTANCFLTYLSAEVSQFLREMIISISNNNRVINKIVANCIEAYSKDANSPIDDEVTFAKKRVAREQISYFLGNTRSKQAIEFLTTQQKLEKDVWVRRGMIHGLAFSGNKEYADTYVEILRDERKHATNSQENNSNIGFQLTFFGDQPLDVLKPDKDQGLPYCYNIVVTCLYLFLTETDRFGWRLNLFTLVDLYKNRPISYNNFCKALYENIDLFKSIISKFEADADCQYWPEIKEAKCIIAEIDKMCFSDAEKRP